MFAGRIVEREKQRFRIGGCITFFSLGCYAYFSILFTQPSQIFLQPLRPHPTNLCILEFEPPAMVGMFLFSRKFSPHLISSASSFCKLHGKFYRGASAVVDVDYSDNSSPATDCRPDIPSFKGLPLDKSVVRVVKSLDWRVVRETVFRGAVDEYGFWCAINAFRMFVHVFAFARMPLEVHALLREIACFYREDGLDLFALLPYMLESLNHGGTEVFVADVLMMVFASESMLEKAVDVFFWAKEVGLKPGIRSCNFLLKCLAESKRRDYLLTVFNEMKNSGPSPTVYTYTILVNFWCKEHSAEEKVDMEKATLVFGEMDSAGITASVVTYSTYIRGFCLDGRPDIALEIMQELRHHNQHLNAYCYNAVMHSLCKVGKLDEALRLFAEMKSCGISPDVYSYSILIEGHNEVGDIMKGLTLFKEMKSDTSNLEPSIVTYNLLLKGLCKNRLRKASAYNFLGSGVHMQGKMDYANGVLEEMIKNNRASSDDGLVDGFCRVGSVDGFARGSCVEGHVRISLEILGEMRNRGINPNVFSYGIIIDRLCKEGKPESALALIPLMLKAEVIPNVVVCCSLVHGFARKEKVDKAKKVYIGMIKFGVTPNTITHTILLNILVASGQVKKAYSIFRQKISNGLTPDKIYYTSMIAGLCKTGDLEKASKLMKDMKKKGHFPSVVTYTCLVDAHCKENRMDLAMLLVNEMRTLSISPDVVTYTVLIQGYLRQGRVEDAHHLFTKMREEGINPDDIMWRILSRAEHW